MLFAGHDEDRVVNRDQRGHGEGLFKKDLKTGTCRVGRSRQRKLKILLAISHTPADRENWGSFLQSLIRQQTEKIGDPSCNLSYASRQRKLKILLAISHTPADRENWRPLLQSLIRQQTEKIGDSSFNASYASRQRKLEIWNLEFWRSHLQCLIRQQTRGEVSE